jgi:YD repeat-containing protein
MLNLTAVHRPGGASRYREYDELNRLTARTNAAGETFTYSYEGKLLKTVRDSRGNSVE